MTKAETKRDRARRELVEVANGMLNGSIDLLSGSRSLVRLHVQADAATYLNEVRPTLLIPKLSPDSFWTVAAATSQ
ncbi:MAG: hypothetical protein JWO19_933 [Bryobacterales bacterium]|nr:hypothetical protein [Bryobacterales bacterium]